VKLAAVLAAVLTLGSIPAMTQGVQEPAPQVQRPTFRSASSLVALNVTVQDRAAKYVSGLQSNDFAVFEDGVKQDVQFFESARVPLDLIVLLDTSASMRDKLDTVHAAASGFLKTLRPDDRGAVVSFSTTVTVAQALTQDQALLQSALKNTQAAGNTCLNNAVYIALKQFGQATQQDGEVRRQAIVILSDGADTASVITFDDVLGLARQMGVSIYTVSLQSAAEARRDALNGVRRFYDDSDYAMKTLAKETGAQAFFPAPGALKNVYASIATELANQYSIGYIPMKTQPDGRFRRVSVQVVTRPELQSRTRLGYTADAGPSPIAHN